MVAGIQYELFEAEWQGMEEANTEHRNRQPGANARYNYLNDLLQMEKCIPHTARIVDRRLGSITTPLREAQWERALEKHPDREFVRWLLQGIREGFRIGYDRSNRCTPSKRNLRSAQDNPSVVEQYLSKELELGRILGPFNPQSFGNIQISPFGVIPKSQLGKWRLIVDLSSPEAESVNDGIDRPMCSLKYITVDDIVENVIKCGGKGALLGKLDIQSAFRIVPVHPDDRHLLGMLWEDQLFIDATLPFGLRSAPKIFNAVADALQWIIRERGVEFVDHYLDDFVIVGRPGTKECADGMGTAIKVCEEVGTPVAPEKLDGPTMCLEILGIEIDTREMILRLPARKIDTISRIVDAWCGRRSGKKVEVQSLVGHLCHACRVVRPGRRFLRGMFTAISHAKKSYHHVRLNAEFRADLEWWKTFLHQWNGMSMIRVQQEVRQVWSDASGSWGCGAYLENKWFQLRWEDYPGFKDACIAAKELLPIVAAAAVWGAGWRGQRIQFNCDNMAVVSVLSSGYCKERFMSHMLRCLFFLEARHDFSIVAKHVPGINNRPADALSRNELPVFLQLIPSALPAPTPLPPKVVEGLLTLQGWTVTGWIKWSNII